MSANRYASYTDTELLSSWRWIKNADQQNNLPEDVLAHYNDLKTEVLRRGLDKE